MQRQPEPTTASLPRRDYQPAMPALWWLHRPEYFLYMVREATCILVGAYAVFLLVLATLDAARFRAVLTSRTSIVLQVIALVMVTYHSVTWFRLAPQAMAVRWCGRRLSPVLISGAHYAAWLLISVAILGAAWHFAGG